MKDSKFNDAQKQNLNDLFTTLGINSSSTPFPNASNMVSNNSGNNVFTQKDIRGGDNSYLSGGGRGSAYFDGLRNYMTDNRGGYGAGAGGGGMQDVSVQRGSGGTGGGSEDTVGNMDANQLLTLNPYLSKNVTSFNEGGMFGEFAKYNHGGTVGSVGSDGTKYSVAPHEQPNLVSFVNDGGREKNRINEIRRREFMEQNNLNPYHVQFTSDPRGDSSYMKAFKAEQDKRSRSGGVSFSDSNPTATEAEASRLKNPWEEGYDNWYGQAENGMRMPKYNDGGMMPQQEMPQQTESYAKQANDMIALAQLEAFGKKFLSQTQGQMPPEIAQAMNQQGIPQANQGMKMKNLSNREKLDNLLKSVPNKEAFNNLSKPDQDSFNNAWFKYGGARTQKRKFTSGGRF